MYWGMNDSSKLCLETDDFKVNQRRDLFRDTVRRNRWPPKFTINIYTPNSLRLIRVDIYTVIMLSNLSSLAVIKTVFGIFSEGDSIKWQNPLKFGRRFS